MPNLIGRSVHFVHESSLDDLGNPAHCTGFIVSETNESEPCTVVFWTHKGVQECRILVPADQDKKMPRTWHWPEN